MIAASGDAKALRPVVAYGAAAAILCGLFALYFLKSVTGPAPEQPPEVLANSAHTLARRLGYADKPAATAYGFVNAGTLKAPEIRFWYRESDSDLQPALIGNFLSVPGRVTPSDPPLEPGMRLIEMDTRGQLTRFTASPQFLPPADLQLDWKALFESAGLDRSAFTDAPAVLSPSIAADHVLRWTGLSSPDSRDLAVAAASWMGQAVYFRVDDLSKSAASQGPFLRIMPVVLICIVFAAFFFARRNLQQQRGDRRGAFRVGAAMFWICAAEWLIVGWHSFTLRQAALASFALSWALAMGVLAYIGYLAIDPTLRRVYPDMLVSLQGILTGGRRDALLGRDILYGLGIAVLASLLSRGVALRGMQNAYNPSALTPRVLAGIWLADLRLGAWVGLFAMALLMPIFALRRKRRMRFGALGVVIAETGIFCLRDMPPVPDVSAWYAQGPLLGYAAFAALAVYGARLAVGSGPGLRGPSQV